jgi:hypothetical protein
MAGSSASGSDAVLRTAMPGHDDDYALLLDCIGVQSAATASSNQDLLKGPRRFVFSRRVFNPAS